MPCTSLHLRFLQWQDHLFQIWFLITSLPGRHSVRKGLGATYVLGSGTTAGDMGGRYHLAFVNVKIATKLIIIINFPHDKVLRDRSLFSA